MPQVQDVELAEGLPRQPHLLLVDPRGLVFPGRHIQFHPPPSRAGEEDDFFQPPGRALSQGDEANAQAMQARQPVLGGQAAVKDQVTRVLAVSLFPEGDEAEDFFLLFPLPDIAVGVAEGLSLGILRQEDQNTGLTPTPRRHIMALHDRVFSVIGDGMEIEVERVPRKKLVARQPLPPRQQSGHLGGTEAGGVFRQIALLGHDIEAGEQSQALPTNQGHHLALPLHAPELQRQEGAARVSKWRRRRSGMNRNSPPHWVLIVRGVSEKARTSATASTVGRGRGGRSSSPRRGRRAKPSWRRTSWTAVGLKGLPCCWRSSLI